MTWLIRLFRRLSLSAKLISSYLVILGVGGLAITLVGSYIVSSTIMAEAQRTVKHELAIARAIYQQELRLLHSAMDVATAGITIPRLMADGDTTALLAYLRKIRAPERMDFLSLADASGAVLLRTTDSDDRGDDATRSRVVASALRGGHVVSGTEIFGPDLLGSESPALREQARIPYRATPRSNVGGEDLDAGLVLAAAAPVRDDRGKVIGVLYAGHLVNRNFTLVDRVWSELYSEESGSGTGTVTIFLGNTRVSTNIRMAEGDRALGTRVSTEVEEAVLGRGERWNSRAFVVGDWYITAYEPIRNVDADVVGMLYVGLPEASYVATRDGVILSFLLIATVGFLLVLGVTFLGIQRMTRPLGEMVKATQSIAAGDLDHKVRVDPDSEGEIARLAGSFNLMLDSLRETRGDLEEWGRTLEEKVHARTDELVRMQSRVAQSERLASIGMLAAGVAHEVNNPLGGILALTALTLEDLPAEDPNRGNLEEVVHQTERCQDIVRHLLEFSRQTAVSSEEVDVNQTLERTLDLLCRQSLFFNISIERHLAAGLPPLRADPAQLQQVFMNIIMNAAQAMAEEGRLTVVTRAVAGDEAVEIVISDTGHGIPHEDLDRIFDPFFTTGKEGHGTGLGLSIAYGIISKHQGTITVESAVGIGTTFTIRLPVTADFGATHRGLDEPDPADIPISVASRGGPP